MSVIANKTIKVIVSKDKLSASLTVNSPSVGTDVSVQEVIDELAGMKIKVSEDVKPDIEQFIIALQKNENPEPLVVVRGIPPKNAQGGQLKKLYKEADDETQQEGEKQSYYDQTKYIVALEGQQLIQILPPVEGSDGTDIFDHPIPHKQGRQAHITLGPNVKQVGDFVIAACNGVVNFVGEKISVNPKLEITGNVDFTSGNVDFPGEVLIGKNVVDLFKVQSQSSVSIGGVVEAAQVNAGGDLIVRGGIAGKEKGICIAAGNIQSKYITNAKIRAGGDINVHSEIVNCDLVCEGQVRVEAGPLVGGHVFAIGGIKVRELGSSVGIKTILEVGIDSNLRQRYEQVAPEVKIRRRKAEKTKQIVEPLLQNRKHLTPEQKEKATELLYQATELECQAQTLIDDLKKLYNEVQEKAASEIEVVGTVFPGVTIRFPKVEGIVKTPISGPLKITPQKVKGVLQVVAIDLNFQSTMTLDTGTDTSGFWENLEELLGLNKA